jgi:ATP-dependent exoDNAse (exonuclease V) beta subunit
MTIHKAKGLEFPVAVLPEVEAAIVRPRVEGIALDREKPHILFLKRLSHIDSPLRERYKQRISAREEEELKRLFYVALTRAKQKLYLFMNTHRAGEKNIWIRMIHGSGLPTHETIDLEIVQPHETLHAPPEDENLYQFTLSKKHPPLTQQVSPSEQHEPAQLSAENERAKLKGNVIHKLFQLLSEKKLTNTRADIEQAVKAIVPQLDTAFIAHEQLQQTIIDDFTSALSNDEIHSVATHPGGLSEFPYHMERTPGEGAIELVHGIIDRVVFDDGEIRVYDYKSDAPGTKDNDAFILWAQKHYGHQLEEYRQACQVLFGIDHVRIFLILTSIAQIIEVHPSP